MMTSYFFLALFGTIASTLTDGVCRDQSPWCPQMTTHGACGFHRQTQKLCSRRCGLCKVQCDNLNASDKRECGHPGITFDQCERRGCCFRRHDSDKTVPWCFYPSQQCKFVEGHKRRDCGFSGMKPQHCLDKGCCWSPLKSGLHHPWCHHSEGVEEGSGAGPDF